jgi:hypothetical protein
MENDNLLKRMNNLGFPLLEAEKGEDLNLTLADMVKANDLRLWEGFSVVLANGGEKGLFDYETAGRYLKNSFDKACFMELLTLSLALYKLFNLKFSWTGGLYKDLGDENRKKTEVFLGILTKGEDVMVCGRRMSGDRLKLVFENYYFNKSQERLNELVSVKNELGLEYSLSQVFSPKQKELFLKKLKREKLTKTEKEYFSRTVKKKIMALANSELHNLAKKINEQG